MASSPYNVYSGIVTMSCEDKFSAIANETEETKIHGFQIIMYHFI